MPRRLLQRPPVLSTCWLITRDALEAAGGFQAAERKGVPESYLARATAGHADGYSFLQSDADIGVTAEKNPDEQQATAIRHALLTIAPPAGTGSRGSDWRSLPYWSGRWCWLLSQVVAAWMAALAAVSWHLAFTAPD